VLAAAGLVAVVLQIVLGPFAGVWVDRVLRRWLMVWADFGVAFLAGLLAYLCFRCPAYVHPAPLLVKERFGKEALELGLMESAWGVGIVLEGLFPGAWGGFRKKIDTAILGIFGVGLG